MFQTHVEVYYEFGAAARGKLVLWHLLRNKVLIIQLGKSGSPYERKPTEWVEVFVKLFQDKYVKHLIYLHVFKGLSNL